MSISSPLTTLYQVLKNVAASAEANASILQKNEAATRAANAIHAAKQISQSHQVAAVAF